MVINYKISLTTENVKSIYSMYRVDEVSIPSMMRAGYPPLLTWSGAQHDASGLPTPTPVEGKDSICPVSKPAVKHLRISWKISCFAKCCHPRKIKTLLTYAPVICKICPPLPPPHTHPYGEWRGQRLFIHQCSAKALHCGDLLRVIALLFIIVTSMGYICVISQARHLPGTAEERQRSLPRTLAPLYPAHPRSWEGGGGQWLQMTCALLTHAGRQSETAAKYYIMWKNKK